MFSSSHISNFNKPRSSIQNSFPLDNKPAAETQQPVQKVHLKSVPQPNNNSPENAEHKLQYRYNLWYSKRVPGKLVNPQSYDQTLKLLASFDTVEEFWKIYSYLLRPCDLSGFFEFHLFKDGK